jgi:hypothetical protein
MGLDWRLVVAWMLIVTSCVAIWYWAVHLVVEAAAVPVVWIGTQLVSH